VPIPLKLVRDRRPQHQLFEQLHTNKTMDSVRTWTIRQLQAIKGMLKLKPRL